MKQFVKPNFKYNPNVILYTLNEILFPKRNYFKIFCMVSNMRPLQLK